VNPCDDPPIDSLAYVRYSISECPRVRKKRPSPEVILPIVLANESFTVRCGRTLSAVFFSLEPLPTNFLNLLSLIYRAVPVLSQQFLPTTGLASVALTSSPGELALLAHWFQLPGSMRTPSLDVWNGRIFSTDSSYAVAVLRRTGHLGAFLATENFCSFLP